ncbi:zinc finger protein 808-like isoform X2 [Polypterus senegalus]|uniref:zinc finger protein 808-like isoform X2 n=1 Tax=Polypterus senegalus TaxID=55291 RepID=UPI0019660E24|nr:zinc finger protein 808-like isoform X2 [Polypterus senegalus]
MNSQDEVKEKTSSTENGQNSASEVIAFVVGENGQLLSVQEEAAAVEKKDESQTPEEELYSPESNSGVASTCDICGKSYKYLRSFVKHREEHYTQGDLSSHDLQVDKLKAKLPPGRFRNHRLSLTPKPRFQSSPTQQSGRKIGENVHLYTCSICGKCYKYKSSFQKHMEEHKHLGMYPELPMEDLESPEGSEVQSQIMDCLDASMEDDEISVEKNNLKETKDVSDISFSTPETPKVDEKSMKPDKLKPSTESEGDSVKDLVPLDAMTADLEEESASTCTAPDSAGSPRSPVPPSDGDSEFTGIFTCNIPLCAKTFQVRSALLIHKKEHRITAKNNTRKLLQALEATDLTCPICGAVFLRKGNLSDHILYVHEKYRPHSCKHCDRQFARPSEVLRHVKRSHPDKVASLEASVIINGNSEESLLFSSFCEKPEADLCSADYEQSNTPDTPGDTNDELVNRNSSSEMFSKVRNSSQTTDLDEHHSKHPLSTSHHQEPVAEIHESEESDCLSMIQISNVTSLVMSPTEFLLFPENKGTMVKDEKDITLSSTPKHGNTKRFTCKICGKEHRIYSSFLKHKLLHTGAKSICLICRRSFLEPRALDEHIRLVHSQRFKYKCTLCEMSFSKHLPFSKHILMAHCDLKKMKCHICKKKYKTAQHLQRHVRKNHSNGQKK